MFGLCALIGMSTPINAHRTYCYTASVSRLRNLRFNIGGLVQYARGLVQQPLADLSNLLQVPPHVRELLARLNVCRQLLSLL